MTQMGVNDYTGWNFLTTKEIHEKNTKVAKSSTQMFGHARITVACAAVMWFPCVCALG